jgi:hypothetical protein
VKDAADALIGTRLDDAALDCLAKAASAACRPIADKGGTKEYRIKGRGRAGEADRSTGTGTREERSMSKRYRVMRSSTVTSASSCARRSRRYSTSYATN